MGMSIIAVPVVAVALAVALYISARAEMAERTQRKSQSPPSPPSPIARPLQALDGVALLVFLKNARAQGVRSVRFGDVRFDLDPEPPPPPEPAPLKTREQLELEEREILLHSAV